MNNKKKIFLLLFLLIFILNNYTSVNNIIDNEGSHYFYGIELHNSFLHINNKRIIDEKVIDFKIYDIDNDSNDEIAVITKKDSDIYGQYVIIYKILNKNETIYLEEIYRKDFLDIKPWKIDICNLDNDGDTDFFIGVYKDTKYYKDIRNRPFFYSWNGSNLYKKWTGSFFTELDLIDVTFSDYMNLGWEQIAILEKNNQGLYRVGLYSFIGFGFQKIAESVFYENVKSISSKQITGKKYIYLEFSEYYIILSASDTRIHDYVKLVEFNQY